MIEKMKWKTIIVKDQMLTFLKRILKGEPVNMYYTNSKLLVLIFTILIISVAQVFVVFPVHGDPSSIYLSPAATTGPPPTIGQTFTLTLKVTGQTDLWSWKVGLTWNPAVVDLQSGAEGPFLKSDGAATIAPGFGGLNHAAGTLNEVSSTRLVATGLSGGGDLQTFTFKVVGYSATASPIAVVNAELHTSASGNPLVPNTAVTGASFTLPGGGDSGATHSFIVVTCVTGVTPLQGVSVSLTGPESQTLTSNSTGKVRFDVTHTGSYSVSGSKSGYQTASGSTSVASAGETKSLSLSLVAGGGSTGGTKSYIKVNCTLNGAAFNGVSVIISGPELRTLVTNSSGIVRFNVTHTGTYTVNSQVNGFQSISKTITITTAGTTSNINLIFTKDKIAPVIIFNITGLEKDNTTYTGKTITFDASKSYDPSNGVIKSYLWNFGDGNFVNGSKVNHIYTIGTYFTITLTCTDSAGNKSWKTATIYVIKPKIKGSLDIDLYTLNESSDGKGTNSTSGPFEPFSKITLFATVKRQGVLMSNQFITFIVRGPPASLPITVYRSAKTTQNGTAILTFTLPSYRSLEQAGIFGNWTAEAYTEYYDEAAKDIMPFKVKWAVNLESQNNTLTIKSTSNGQTVFDLLNDQSANMEIKLFNQFKSIKTENITLQIFDYSGNEIFWRRLNNYKLSPGINSLNEILIIPHNAESGTTTAKISLIPSKYDPNAIIPNKQLKPFQIISKGIQLSYGTLLEKSVYEGRPLNMTIALENKGDTVTNATIRIHSNQTQVGIVRTQLSPQTSRILTYQWNTTNYRPGQYTLTASVDNTPFGKKMGNNTIVLGKASVIYPSATVVVQWFGFLELLTAVTCVITLFTLVKRNQEVYKDETR